MRQGRDHRKASKKARRKAKCNLHRSSNMAPNTFENREVEFNSDRAKLSSSLPKLYLIPHPNEVVSQIDAQDALKPIFHWKADAAEEALDRLSIALRRSRDQQLDNDLAETARAKDLPETSRHIPEPILTMPWGGVPKISHWSDYLQQRRETTDDRVIHLRGEADRKSHDNF